MRRVGAELSRAKLASLAGLSEATIKFLETGRIDKPSMRTLLKLLRTAELGLTLTDLPEPLARSVVPYLRLDSPQPETTHTTPRTHAQPSLSLRCFVDEPGLQSLGASDCAVWAARERDVFP